jgi:thioredoxin reductase
MTIKTDAVIVGAGPVGLFQVFELGLLGLKADLVDSLAQVGGQCSELYPEKPIYDIPAWPTIGAQELVDKLVEQIRPFEPGVHLGQEVTEFEVLEDNRFRVVTSKGTEFDAGSVIIAAGLGAFQPRRLRAKGLEDLKATNVHYKVTDRQQFAGKRLIILGGGDSALDWTLDLADIAAHITLAHRRKEYRAQPASVAKMKELVEQGKVSEQQGTVGEALGVPKNSRPRSPACSPWVTSTPIRARRNSSCRVSTKRRWRRSACRNTSTPMRASSCNTPRPVPSCTSGLAWKKRRKRPAEAPRACRETCIHPNGPA